MEGNTELIFTHPPVPYPRRLTVGLSLIKSYQKLPECQAPCFQGGYL